MKSVAKFFLKGLPFALIRLLLLSMSFEYRNRVAAEVKVGQKILSGPFKNGIAIESRWSGTQYIPAQLAGSYERELVTWITSSGPYDLVIDLGAAEGFYALNLLELDYRYRLVAFERDEASREDLKANAKLLLSTSKADRLLIFSAASESEIIEISRGNLGERKLLICDIEGAEFDLFSIELLRHLRSFDIAIELHSNDQAKISRLRTIIEWTHSVQIIDRTLLDFSTLWDLFPDATELEIANLAHEGRSSRQSWLLARPKDHALSKAI